MQYYRHFFLTGQEESNLKVGHVALFPLDHGGHVVYELEVEGVLRRDLVLGRQLNAVVVVLGQLGRRQA